MAPPSGELAHYDYFGQQKVATLEDSLGAISLLGEHLLEVVTEPGAPSQERKQRAVADFLGVSTRQRQKDASPISVYTVIGTGRKGSEPDGCPGYVFLPLVGIFHREC